MLFLFSIVDPLVDTVKSLADGFPFPNIFPTGIEIEALWSLALWIPVFIMGAMVWYFGVSRVFWVFLSLGIVMAFVPYFSDFFLSWWTVPILNFTVGGWPIKVTYGTFYMFFTGITFMAFLGAVVSRGSENPVIRGGGVAMLFFGLGGLAILFLTGQLDKLLPFLGLG